MDYFRSHDDLNILIRNYINGCIFSRKDLILSLFLPSIVFGRNADKICQLYNKIHEKNLCVNLESEDVQIKLYDGGNSYVLKMMDYLNHHLKNDLKGAYIHGSLGTYDEIFYSDFDALVILKNQVFETPARLATVAQKLNRARTIMFDFDPLQHHGWFIITEHDLSNYPQYYFPLELFEFAKSLFDDKGLKLTIQYEKSPEKGKKVFDNLSDSIITKLTTKKYPDNMYQLKSLLSQFMLLPAVYVQVRDAKGIYKKFSFSAAEADFAEKEWSVMDEVSAIREKWNYKISYVKRWLITGTSPVSRFLAKKCAPAISPHIKSLLEEDLYQKMLNLVTDMQNRLRFTAETQRPQRKNFKK